MRCFIVVVLCIAAAPVVCGQGQGKKTLTRPPLDETQIAKVAGAVAISKVPPLFGLNRIEVEGVLKRFGLRPRFSSPENGIAVAQDPPAGTSVKAGRAISVTLGVLALIGPAAPAYAGSDLTFTAAMVPPLLAGTQVMYYFNWGDGSSLLQTKDAVVTHRFAEAGRWMVTVTAVVNDRRFKFGSRMLVDVVAAPSATDTSTSTAPPDTIGSTATVAQTNTQTTATTQTIDTTPTTTIASTTTQPVPKPDDSRQTALLLIGVIAIILLLTVTGLFVRVFRKINGTPSSQPPSPLAIKGGAGSIEYEIEHPGRIRQMPSVLVRGGIRPEGDDDA